jgi:hypothetical protein
MDEGIIISAAGINATEVDPKGKGGDNGIFRMFQNRGVTE